MASSTKQESRGFNHVMFNRGMKSIENGSGARKITTTIHCDKQPMVDGALP